MIKNLFKYLFWSALAILFCSVIGKSSVVRALSNDIKISEVFYDPVGDDTGYEWIELYNSSNSVINLTGYNLFYYTGTYYVFPSFTLNGKSYVLIHNNCAGLDSENDLYTGTTDSNNMGNTSGSIAIFNSSTHSSATIVDFVQYGADGKTWESSAVSAGIWTAGDFTPDVAIGHSISLKDLTQDNNSSADWVDLGTPTPKGEEMIDQGGEELIDIPPQIEIITIGEARQKEAGIAVIVTGTVTIIPGVLSDQYFYIQDETGGIQIYCYKKDFPALIQGDQIQVEGEISDYYGDKRIKITQVADIIVIGQSQILGVIETSIDQIGDDDVGKIVTFEGTISETSGATFYVEGSGEIKVNIKEETGIDKPRMSRGDIVRITGVVSRHKDTFQVLPFEQSGVTILTSGSLPGAGRSRDGPIYKLLFCFALWNI